MGDSASPIVVFLVGTAIIIVVSVIILKDLLISRDGYGVYGPVKYGPCIVGLSPTSTIVNSSNNTGQVPPETSTVIGVQTNYQECIPDPVTLRGCITSNNIQSYESKITQSPCTPITFRSVWSDDVYGICSPDTSLIDVTKTCIISGDGINGINGCTSSGQGGTVSYNVGESVSWVEECIPLAPINPLGMWKGNGSFTPSFTGQYAPEENCNIEGDPQYGILSEGYTITDMTCDTRCTNLVSTQYINGQICNPTIPQMNILGRRDTLTHTDIIRRFTQYKIPSDINPIICGAVVPEVIAPCRYRPLTVSYGNSNIDILASSIILLLLPGNRTITSIQTPSLISNPQIKRLYDWGNMSTDPLGDTPLTYIDPAVETLNVCNGSQISFNTGILFMLGPRSVNTSIEEMECVIGAMIPSTYNGWMKTGIGNTLFWTQAKDTPISQGTMSFDTQLFKINVISALDPTPQPGYPIGCKGRITLSIRDVSNNRIWLPSIDGLIEPNIIEPLVSLDSVDAILFPLDTQLCTRSLRDTNRCNLMIAPKDPELPDVYCQAPLLTPGSI